jgi:hypothetical protein
MTVDQINLLIAYIDARIREHMAQGTHDGGLAECVDRIHAEEALRAGLKD